MEPILTSLVTDMRGDCEVPTEQDKGRVDRDPAIDTLRQRSQ